MKVTGSFDSILRGVSEQPADVRLEGQCAEQVNLIPDPVRGLVRRPGSTFLAESVEENTGFGRTFSYRYDGAQIDVLYPYQYSLASSGAPLTVNKSAEGFIPVVGDDTALSLIRSGLSAITAIGRYVVMVPSSGVVGSTSTNMVEENRAVIWVRGGAHSRTFTATITKLDDSEVTISYTTPSASYQGLLDTSDVPVFVADSAGGTIADTESAYVEPALATAELTWYAWSPTSLSATKGGSAMTNTHPAAPTTTMQYSWAPGARYVQFTAANVGATDISLTYTHRKTVPNPNYARVVGELTNAYNSAVTSWIGTAAAAIQPAAIAEQLRVAAAGAGLSASRQDGSVLLTGVKSVVVQDGGDGTLIRGVDSEVPSIDQVSTIHWVGHTVYVRPRGTSDGFYLVARPKKAGATGWAEVTWEEGPGVKHELFGGFILGTVIDNEFHVAAGPTYSFPGISDVPQFVPSRAGDATTSPLPYFVGKKITLLAVMQDRLIVGCGGVIRCSRVGDYFNFFRSSILTVPADDPFEVASLGNEDDELRYAALYDRDMVLFGRDRQYVLPGRAPLSPTNAVLPVMSSHKGAADCPPIETGGLIMYAKHGETSSSVFEVRPGLNAESPQAFPLSPQLNGYIRGRVVEMIALARPSVLILRTDAAQNNLYMYSFLDDPEGRKQSAWYQFIYSPTLGPIIGLAYDPYQPDRFQIFTARSNGVEGNYIATADLQSMNTTPERWVTHLDSSRNYDPLQLPKTYSYGDWAAVVDDPWDYYGVGVPWEKRDDLASRFPGYVLRVGSVTPAFWVPTNPTPKDGRGQPILTGRCTVTMLVVGVQETGGLESTITDVPYGQNSETFVFNGRLVNDPGNLVGRAVRTTNTVTLPVGRERSEYMQTITSRNWQPMAITSVNWVGQLFNRSPRI